VQWREVVPASQALKLSRLASWEKSLTWELFDTPLWEEGAQQLRQTLAALTKLTSLDISGVDFVNTLEAPQGHALPEQDVGSLTKLRYAAWGAGYSHYSGELSMWKQSVN